MANRRVSATEFARNLSSMLNEVHYRSASLEIWRGKECVARVVPSQPPSGFPVDQLGGFFASLPRLVPGDAQAFETDLSDLDHTVLSADDPWA